MSPASGFALGRDWPGHRYLGLAARLLLAVVFFVAGGTKLLDPSVFALRLSGYEILPPWAIAIVAALLPWIEIVLALWLAAGYALRPAIATIGAMLLGFMVALGSVLLRGLDVSCGCFGGADSSPTEAIVRNAALLLCAAYVWQFDRQPLRLNIPAARR